MVVNANNMDTYGMGDSNSKVNNKKGHQIRSGRDFHIPAKDEFHGF
jgi:hypothetical protein